MSQATRYSGRRIAADAIFAATPKPGIGLLERRFATEAGAASSSRLDSGPEVHVIASLIGLLRRGGSTLVLLVAALLIAPTIDCGLLEPGAHAHASVSPVAGADQAAMHGHDPDDANLRSIEDHCGPHIAHCIVKSLLPGTASTVLPVQLLGLMLVTALVVLAAVLSRPTGGVRAPPGRPLPADRRDILTRLCIARR
ncbi:hypothetical protein LTT66_12680 [Nocardia gipuzkoensis]|nr:MULTISPECIES: hypothetical protein [Nocardia]UGT70938.1 hypothetical protein LTT66_12680 [Nocardia gipuzkoensis]